MENLLFVFAGIAWMVLALGVGRTVMAVSRGGNLSWQRGLLFIFLSYGLGLFMLLLLLA